MKILESKFYRQPEFLVTKRVNGKSHIIPSDQKYGDRIASREPYTDLLSSILSPLLSRSQLVIKTQDLADFEKCEDFLSLSYSKELWRLIEDEVCYFHPETEVFLVLTENLSTDYDKEIFEDGILRVRNAYYDNANFENHVNIQALFDKYLSKYISSSSKISLLVKEGNDIELNEYKIQASKIDFNLMYQDDFLPVSEHIVDQLKHSSKGIVLLHGEPGTGKTNYIKRLTSQISEKKFIFVPTTMIAQMTEPYFINFLIENRNAILIFEDCENYISERNSYNSYTDVVASILNLADGILSDVVECQIICTFNAAIDQIDSALLRKGRLIAEYCFKPLPIEKVNAYLQSIHSEQRVEQPMVLTDMINIANSAYKEEKKSESSIGFSTE